MYNEQRKLFIVHYSLLIINYRSCNILTVRAEISTGGFPYGIIMSGGENLW